MRITQLEYFISLAESLSFTRSAEECYVTQPVISQQISALESDLGFKLFDRTTRGVRLTDAGMFYYPYAIEIVKTTQQAQTRALAVANGRIGKLTIGVFGGLQIHGLGDIVSFSKENPEVDLHLRLVSSLEQYQELKQGAFDTVFSSVAFLSRFDDVACVNPVTNRICAVVSRNHPLAKRRVISERELLGFTAIVTERFQYEMDNGLASYPETDVFGKVRTCENFDMVWLFTRLNMGVALFPSYTKSSLQDDLVMIQIKEKSWHLTEAWCSLTDNTNPVLQSFIEYLEKEGG